MNWRNHPGPVEPSAAERIGPRECAACHHTGPAMERRRVAGIDEPVWLRVDPAACTERAQDAGIYATGGR